MYDLEANLKIEFSSNAEGQRIANRLKAISKKYNTKINVEFIKINKIKNR